MSLGVQTMLLGVGLIVSAVLSRFPAEYCPGGSGSGAGGLVIWAIAGTLGLSGVVALVTGAAMQVLEWLRK